MAFLQNFFLNVGTGSNKRTEDKLLEMLKVKWQSEHKLHFKISHVTLKKLISNLNPGEGHDGIHAAFLKRSSVKFLDILSRFMMACYSHCCLPVRILSSDINPTIKDAKGNSTESSNYRPVMQSSCILKLFEMHLLQFLEEKIHFNTRQFGFKSHTSTADACLILKETIHKYSSKGGKAFCLFVDLSKAFDNVNNFTLGLMLLRKNIPPDIVFFMMLYLRNLTARILWNRTKGLYHNIEKRVRQGGILSPFLFKLYIDEALTEILANEIGCRLGFLRINILAYADDLVLVADNENNLATLYDILNEKMRHLQLAINKVKSKAMIFSQSYRQDETVELEIGDDRFEVVSHYKYLGHILQANMQDNKDAKHRLNSFYSKFNWVFRNFRNTSLDVLTFLFNAYCTPDYGLPLWCLDGLVNRQDFKTFEVAYNNAFKRMIGVPIGTSSHAAAEAAKPLLFKHHFIYIQTRFFKRI